MQIANRPLSEQQASLTQQGADKQDTAVKNSPDWSAALSSNRHTSQNGATSGKGAKFGNPQTMGPTQGAQGFGTQKRSPEKAVKPSGLTASEDGGLDESELLDVALEESSAALIGSSAEEKKAQRRR